MSVYTKRTVVIKEVQGGYSKDGKAVSGIARVEENEYSTSLSLTLLNLVPLENGEYFAVVKGGKDESFVESLGSFPMSVAKEYDGVLSIAEGVSVAVIHLNDNVATAVAYGSSGRDFTGLGDMKARFIRDYVLKTVAPKIKYKDDEIAEINYFDKTELDELTKDFVDEKETAQTYFYDKQAEELESVLNKNPPDDDLNTAVDGGRFVKIYYDQNKFYAVGIISDKGVPKYICYGVPAKYSAEPPDALKGYSSFLPVDVFDLKGKGYWMMYQSVKDGSCVKMRVTEY